MFGRLCARFRGCGAELSALRDTVHQLIEGIRKMSAELQAKIDKLVADVTALTTTEQKAVALIGGFSQQLKDAIAAAQAAGMTPDQGAAFDALDQSISGATADLAAAVAAASPAPAPQA